MLCLKKLVKKTQKNISRSRKFRIFEEERSFQEDSLDCVHCPLLQLGPKHTIEIVFLLLHISDPQHNLNKKPVRLDDDEEVDAEGDVRDADPACKRFQTVPKKDLQTLSKEQYQD